jgi:PAS domain S-box-containing protein
MLRVNSDQPQHFSEQDVLRLTPLAQAAAIAIENARLYEQAQGEIEKRRQTEGELEKRVERRTAESQKLRQQASTLIQLNPHGIIEWDKDFQVVVWNPGAVKIFGYSEEEALQQHAQFITPEEAHAHLIDIWQHLLSQSGGTHRVNENMTKDGRRIICNWYHSPLVNADGTITGVASFVEDITERKHAEIELANRTRLLEILNNLSSKASFLLELNPLLAQIADSISELFDVPNVYISNINLTDRTSTVLAEHISTEASSSVGNTYHLEDDFGLDIEWLQSVDRAYVSMINAPETTPQERAYYDQHGIKAVLGVPLHAQGKIAGLIELYEDRYEREFTEEEIEFLSAISAQLSVTIDNANLFAQATHEIQERQQAEHALARRTQLLETLNKLSREASFTLDLDPILNQVCQSVAELFDATSAYISKYNLEEGTLTVVAEYLGPEATDKERLSDLGTTYDMEEEFGIDPDWFENPTQIHMFHVDDPQSPPEERQHLEKYGIKSTLSAQFHHQGQPIGILEIYESRHRREFTEEEAEFIGAIANQLAVNIDNANLYEQITRELHERQTAEETLSQRLQVESELAQASQALVIGSENALKETLHHLLKAADANRVTIFKNFEEPQDGLCTRQIHEILAPGMVAQREKDSRHNTFQYEDQLASWREKLEAGKVINSFAADLSEEERNLLASPDTAAFLAIPITVQGNWYGFISFEKMKRDQIWDEQDVQLLQTAASMIGSHIERRQLEQEAQSSLERRSRELQLLTQMAQEIALAPDLPDLYKRLVTVVKEQFGYYYTQLMRYNPTLDVVELIAGYGKVGEEMLAMHHSMPMGVGLIGIAAELGQSLLSPNVMQDPNWQPNPLLARTKGELVVPIKIGERVLGVLDVQSDAANELNINDQILLEGLCGQIAVAIESANLRQEMADRLREVNSLHQIMTREGWQEYHGAEKMPANGYIFNKAEVQPLVKQEYTNGRSTPTQSNGKTFTQPLAVRGTMIGAIGIQDDQERPLSEEDKEFLDAISGQVAEALEMARLLDTTQEALVTQERLSTELRTVAEVSTVTSTIMERDRLLQNVVDLTKTSFNLYHAHLYLLNEAGDTLTLVAGADQVGRLMTLEENHIPIRARSFVARAARSREPIVENNARQSPDFMAHPLLPHTRSELAAPMIVGDRLVGVLDVLSDVVNRFADQDILIMRTLASQVAVAVQNAEQYAEQVATAEKLREVEKLKSEFLASMSHELRTPLNSIIGFADVLLEGLDGELNDRMEQDVRLIRDSGDHLRNLIGDILDMSKIEAGKMELRYEEIEIHQMAQDIIATATPLAQEKGLRLHLNLADDLFNIHADRTRMRQILWNIMGNAIKFTPKGGITVTMQTQDDNLLVSVRDTGIGIMPENIPIVFEQFRQVDGSLNRTAEGTGLGMPITKKLVELHGGEIWVESVFGVGTTFWFTLPRFPTNQIENEMM